MDELPVSQITLKDPFWSRKLETNSRHSIFHQYEMLEASGCIDNFRILVGDKEGFREGWFFADSDAYKWLDAAARISPPDPHLTLLMDNLIDLIRRAQSKDGYIFTYNQIHFPGQRWVNLQIEHELYCLGHLIEAAVSHFQATQQTSLLSVARLAADLLVKDFMQGGAEDTCGHEEIELALLRLYQITQNTPYLELARGFIDRRGRSAKFPISIFQQNASVEARKKIIQQQRTEYVATHPEYATSKVPPGNFAKMPPYAEQRRILNSLSGKYFQQHTPIRRQITPEGHSVRFGYFQTAAAMLNRLQPDPSLQSAMEQAWEHMITRRMYVTGGVGSQPSTEGFGNDYELDPELAYNETCAALAIQFWSWELALTTGKAQYSDLFEWQMYNASAVGMGQDGKTYLYNNPLTVRGGITRRAWYAVPCCPSNLSRTYASLGKYIYAANKTNIWIHQYIGSQAELTLGVPLNLKIESELPWSGKVRLLINPAMPASFTINLRLPSWAAGEPAIHLTRSGKTISLQTDQGQTRYNRSIQTTAQGYDPRQSRFLKLERTWEEGDVLELEFPMDIHQHKTLPQVKGHTGKIAVSRGPLVYCLESIDNPGLDIFNIRLRPETITAEYHPEILGGTLELHARSTDGQPVVLIPYHLWGNRGESQMVVWINT